MSNQPSIAKQINVALHERGHDPDKAAPIVQTVIEAILSSSELEPEPQPQEPPANSSKDRMITYAIKYTRWHMLTKITQALCDVCTEYSNPSEI